MKIVLGVFAGVAVAILSLVAFEFLRVFLFVPRDLDLDDPVAVDRALNAMPVGALLLIAFGWGVGCLIGGVLADRIAGRALAGWLVALLIAAAAFINLASIEHPAWLWPAVPLLPAAGAWLAQRLTKTAL